MLVRRIRACSHYNLILLSFTDGTHRSSVRTYCALPAGAPRQCPSVEPASAQCHPVCRRTRLQVARACQQRFGKWHTVYTRMNRWAKNAASSTGSSNTCNVNRSCGSSSRRSRLTARSSRSIPMGPGRVQKNGPQAIGKSRGGWTTKLHLVAADARTAVTVLALPWARLMMRRQGRNPAPAPGSDRPRPRALVMDRAYEGQKTRQLAVALGFKPVVPPRQNRRDPWAYDRPAVHTHAAMKSSACSAG